MTDNRVTLSYRSVLALSVLRKQLIRCGSKYEARVMQAVQGMILLLATLAAVLAFGAPFMVVVPGFIFSMAVVLTYGASYYLQGQNVKMPAEWAAGAVGLQEMRGDELAKKLESDGSVRWGVANEWLNRGLKLTRVPTARELQILRLSALNQEDESLGANRA